MELIQTVANWTAGILLSGGVFTAFGFWLFKLFGERWMENRFARNLEALRHEQTRELERLRFQVASMLDRASKVHQREYEILPEVWSALVEADRYIQSTVSSFRQYPNVMFATPEQLEEVLEATELSATQKQELRELEKNDRQRAFARFLDRQSAWQAEQVYRTFHQLFLRHGIFIGDGLKQQIERYSDLAWAALVEHQSNLDDEGQRERARKKELQNLGKEMLAEIQQTIHKQLWQTELPAGEQHTAPRP